MSRSPIKPLRWLAHLPLAILPFLAAAAIEGPALQRAVAERVAAALADAGQGWAKPFADGRDIEIRGLAPSRAAYEQARAVVAGTFGVRLVAMHAGVSGS